MSDREPESVDPLMAGIRRRNRRIFIATILVFVLPLGFVTRSCALSASHGYSNFENRLFDHARFEHDLTADQRATIDKALAEASARRAESKQGWRAAIDAAIKGGITSRPDLGKCPESPYVGPRGKDQWLSAPSWLEIAKSPADVPTAEPALWSSAEVAARGLASRAAAQHTDEQAERLVKDATAFARDEVWSWDVLMVIDKRVEPVSLSGKAGFESGIIEGRAYLYDYRRKAITCAGLVHAENSDEVRFKYTRRIGDLSDGSGTSELARALDDDLRYESYRAAAEAVRFRAGPKAPDEP